MFYELFYCTLHFHYPFKVITLYFLTTPRINNVKIKQNAIDKYLPSKALHISITLHKH